MLPEGMSRAQFALLNHLIRLGGDHSLVDLARAFGDGCRHPFDVAVGRIVENENLGHGLGPFRYVK